MSSLSLPSERTHWDNIAFIAGLCERHLLNFTLYCDSMGKEQDSALYRKLLNKVWEYLAGQLKSAKNLENALLHIETITPEPDTDSHYGVYPALDACLLLTSALQMTLDHSIDDADQASQVSLATVGQFIALRDGISAEAPAVETDDLYRMELDYQQTLWQQIKLENSQVEIVKSLRRQLAEHPVSNLGIELS